MTENEVQERLKDYSTKTNVNAMNIELLKQSSAVNEKRLDEYHKRLHESEDTLLVIKTVQAIHDTQIQALRKILVGNGERETIPMDIERLEREIQDILKVDWRSMKVELVELDEWKKEVTSRVWQISVIVIGLVITTAWKIFFP